MEASHTPDHSPETAAQTDNRLEISGHARVIQAQHTLLDAHFRRFQEALVGLDLAEAREHLSAYHEMLADHIADEESTLLTPYEQLVTHPPRGGSASLFRDEHRKLLHLLDELHGRLNYALEQGQTPQQRSDVLELLERSFLARGLAEHHHLREETILFPAWTKLMANKAVRAQLA